ncbi:Grx4 family monothiol glutaredoxin [Ignatzschineria rhizosphaerae]|uniref:Glutaredoxin n=1 Tax=Ignatzschineria rhizosphaerae TaxID=2923279 RepID=A0ABY3X3P6_9GAMM|nr:Grx4 family monothiol glutaredoxin [Ignatzschineria rhizosphaerae]UNM97513.1 Grx4 family monothiol glutaredoxin [Ignatzschineria rhizosphaerae]
MTEKATLEKIHSQVTENPVVIYMKGSPQFPMCGFSSRAAQALADTGLPFSFVNVMDDSQIFEHLPKYADWPTFPQIYIGGELIGGCDIVLELAERNSLKQMMNDAIENQA